jgi:hypothetical protein
MKKLKWPHILDFKKAFRKEETRFILAVGLKVTLISMAINLFIYYLVWRVLRINYAFFRALGFPDSQDDNIFVNYVTSEALENLSVLFVFHICLFFIGVYVGWLILRPFRVLGDYCEEVLENPNAIYRVDEFSTYRLLTRFSEFFFEYLRESRKRGEISTNSIPPQFSRIHAPVLDYVFLLHFGILLVIIAITSAVFIIENTTSILQSMMELAEKTLKRPDLVNKFFSNQGFITDETIGLTVVLIVICYTLLGFHLYAKVSGAAFGIFSTMRAFMKGNYYSRVHLVGYSYIREHTRKLNKYLDYMENKFQNSTTKVENPPG